MFLRIVNARTAGRLPIERELLTAPSGTPDRFPATAVDREGRQTDREPVTAFRGLQPSLNCSTVVSVSQRVVGLDAEDRWMRPADRDPDGSFDGGTKPPGRQDDGDEFPAGFAWDADAGPVATGSWPISAYRRATSMRTLSAIQGGSVAEARDLPVDAAGGDHAIPALSPA
jgi:hypothetical protein